MDKPSEGPKGRTARSKASQDDSHADSHKSTTHTLVPTLRPANHTLVPTLPPSNHTLVPTLPPIHHDGLKIKFPTFPPIFSYAPNPADHKGIPSQPIPVPVNPVVDE